MDMTEAKQMRAVAPLASSTVDLVLHEIRRSILDGTLAPGKPFVVQSITEQLGVSHVPVREALRQLEAQGLVSLQRSRSAVVTPLELSDLENIYRLRLCIEPELSAQSAESRSDDEIDELASLAQAMYDDYGAECTWDLHRDFHTLLIQPAAGDWGMRLVRVLWDAAERYTRLTFDPSVTPDDERSASLRRHQALVDAARTRNGEKMFQEMRDHLVGNQMTTAAQLRAVVE